MFISNPKTYDALKFIAQILLPALGTLYFALAGIWGLPEADRVVGTILVIDTFLGIVLQISTSVYNKSEKKYDGSIDVGELATGNKTYSLVVNGDPEDIDQKDEILFKVNKSKTV